MSKDLLPRIGLAAAITFSGLGSPTPASAEPTSDGANIISENPLQEKTNFTPEVLLTIGGEPARVFNTSPQFQTEFEYTPTEADGIYPEATTDFINGYLVDLPQPIDPTDLTWTLISTDLSETKGAYMTQSTIKTGKLDGFAVPGSFSASAIYQDNLLVETYMEFQVPDLNLPQATEDEYFNALTSIIFVPDGPVNTGVAEVPFDQVTNPDGSVSGGFIEKYFALLFEDGGFSTLALINEFGTVHVLTALPETMTENLNSVTDPS